MKKTLLNIAALCALVPCAIGCMRVVPDANENVYSFKIDVETVGEGDDIPVHLLFSEAGYTVDNVSWGNPWAKSVFYGTIEDASGRVIDNAVFNGPDGVIGDGSRLDIDKSRKYDFVISHLRKGEYTLKITLETRYTVPCYASATFTVTEKGGGDPGDSDVYIKDFTIPDENCGLDIDPIGNIILDIRIFNASNPFRYISTVTPANATDKQLLAGAESEDILSAGIEGETTIVLVPKKVGKSNVTVRARKGSASRTFGVTVIESEIPTEGFTLPTDPQGGDPNIDFDLGGRLALDINAFANPDGTLPGNNPYQFECQPIPSTATGLKLTAQSDDEDVVKADIVSDKRLRLFPQGVGYATVTVSTTDGKIVRKLRVAVISKIDINMNVEEGTPSADDERSSVFPCTIRIVASSRFLPYRLQMDVFGKVYGRIDLTDPADYFLVEELKNSRTALYDYETTSNILIVGPQYPSGYDVYTLLMSRVAAQSVPFHHSDDYPNYYDGVKYYRLYSLTIEPSVKEGFDTNLYRITINKNYDNPANRIYQYLH